MPVNPGATLSDVEARHLLRRAALGPLPKDFQHIQGTTRGDAADLTQDQDAAALEAGALLGRPLLGREHQGPGYQAHGAVRPGAAHVREGQLPGLRQGDGEDARHDGVPGHGAERQAPAERELRPGSCRSFHARREGPRHAAPGQLHAELRRADRTRLHRLGLRQGWPRVPRRQPARHHRSFPGPRPEGHLPVDRRVRSRRGRLHAAPGRGGEIDRVVDIIFQHRDSTGKNTVARRTAYRLCEYFAHANPTLTTFVDEVVADSGFDTTFDISALLRSILTHDDFYLTAADVAGEVVAGEEPKTLGGSPRTTSSSTSTSVLPSA